MLTLARAALGAIELHGAGDWEECQLLTVYLIRLHTQLQSSELPTMAETSMWGKNSQCAIKFQWTKPPIRESSVSPQRESASPRGEGITFYGGDLFLSFLCTGPSGSIFQSIGLWARMVNTLAAYRVCISSHYGPI